MTCAAVLGRAAFLMSDSECGAPSGLLLTSLIVAPDFTVIVPGAKREPSWMYWLTLKVVLPVVVIVFFDAAWAAGADTPSAAMAARATAVRRFIVGSSWSVGSPAWWTAASVCE